MKEHRNCYSVSIIINPLTARVVGAPQMILQPVFSIFPRSPMPSGTCRTPGLSIPWCCLPTSSFVHLPCQDGFGQTGDAKFKDTCSCWNLPGFKSDLTPAARTWNVKSQLVYPYWVFLAAALLRSFGPYFIFPSVFCHRRTLLWVVRLTFFSVFFFNIVGL